MAQRSHDNGCLTTKKMRKVIFAALCICKLSSGDHYTDIYFNENYIMQIM